MSESPYQQAKKQIKRRSLRRFLFRAHVVSYVVGVILWFFWLRVQPIGYPVYLLFPTLWAFLLIGHWVYHSSASAQDEALDSLWENLYGTRPDDPHIKSRITPDNSSPDPLARIRRAVEIELAREKSKRRKLLFRVNVVVYLAMMLMGWIIIPIAFGPFLTESSALTIFTLSIAGLVELIVHYVALRLDSDAGERGLREQLLGRAIQEAMFDGHFPEKDKPKRTSRLSDDGEIVDVNDWDDDDSLLKNQASEG